MSNTLKQDNKFPLAAILVSTVVILMGVQYGIDQVIGRVATFKDLGFAIVATTASYLLANIMPADLKHLLVYAGYKYALPGHRCNNLCVSDPRIDIETVSKRWPEIFSDETNEKHRNAMWYTDIYSKVKDVPEVLQSHGSFLLYRDVFSALLVLLMFSIIWWFVQGYFDLLHLQIWVSLVLVAEAVFFMYLARIWGNRMVVNSVAAAMGGFDD